MRITFEFYFIFRDILSDNCSLDYFFRILILGEGCLMSLMLFYFYVQYSFMNRAIKMASRVTTIIKPTIKKSNAVWLAISFLVRLLSLILATIRIAINAMNAIMRPISRAKEQHISLFFFDQFTENYPQLIILLTVQIY